jgi:hypothetical protein
MTFFQIKHQIERASGKVDTKVIGAEFSDEDKDLFIYIEVEKVDDTFDSFSMNKQETIELIAFLQSQLSRFD